jgi:hypothetical protein
MATPPSTNRIAAAAATIVRSDAGADFARDAGDATRGPPRRPDDLR